MFVQLFLTAVIQCHSVRSRRSRWDHLDVGVPTPLPTF